VDLTVVVPTKDRPAEVAALLADLAAQSCPPHRVLLLDAGARPLEAPLSPLGPDWIGVLRHRPPSTALQRNRGATAAGTPLIAFIDDDMRFAGDAFRRMGDFWDSPAAGDVVAAGFNIVGANAPAPRLKGGRLTDRLGLYPSRPGTLAPSGWQSMIGAVDDDRDVDWLPAGAVVWRTGAFADLGGFDPYFSGYGYLEDLDLSWRARLLGRLRVVAAARCRHLGAVTGKAGAAEFGRIEVRNRLYLVRKHGLSRGRCAAGLLIRAALTLRRAVLQRDAGAWARFGGNLRGLGEELRGWHGR
jgi:GT2 family glycosyltransferase